MKASKNLKIILFLLVSMSFFQSCFEVVEQVYVKKDGSGNFQLTINLSQSRTRLNSIMAMKSINGHDVPSKEKIREKMAGIEQIFNSVKGISNAKANMDFSNFIATINCNFSKISQINEAINKVYIKENGKEKGFDKTYNYDIVSNVFLRINKIPLKEEYKKMSNADKEIFSNASYTSIYKFESDVVAATNPETKIAASKKATMLKLSALDVATEKKSIENKITLSK